MGMIFIYCLILLLFYLSIGISLFIYSRMKKSKIGLIISVMMILFVILVLFTNKIDEITISKKEIITDLKHIEIELEDDFIITNNEVTGLPERIQETEIQITQNDKNRIINKIKNSVNFKLFANEQEMFKDKETEQFGTSGKVLNFKYPEFYSREKYLKIDNISTRLFVSIYDNKNTLKYQRIED